MAECKKLKYSDMGDYADLRNRLKNSNLFKKAPSFGEYKSFRILLLFLSSPHTSPHPFLDDPIRLTTIGKVQIAAASGVFPKYLFSYIYSPHSGAKEEKSRPGSKKPQKEQKKKEATA